MADLTNEEIELLSAKSNVLDVVEVTYKLLKRDSANSKYSLQWYVEEFLRAFESIARESWHWIVIDSVLILSTLSIFIRS